MNKEKFNFTLPAKAENLTILRLTTSAIASKMGFDIDKIEDLKLCVSEVCNIGIATKKLEDFKLEYLVGDKEIQIIFKDLKLDTEVENLEMSKMILQALIEDVEFLENQISLKVHI